MESDLREVVSEDVNIHLSIAHYFINQIHSRQHLTDDHFQWLIYQMLCGLKFIHSTNVIHHDIKPSNLFVNADCKLKIGDFNVAIGHSSERDMSKACTRHGYLDSEYAPQLWYRAPEILLDNGSYVSCFPIFDPG